MQFYGADLAVGYDIACSFATTVKNSSLASRAEELRLQLVVPAFHGYAHNRRCQLSWHPLYLQGLGIEDFEVCEHVFKGSNALASITCHTTHFHRQQAIDMYFRQHDEDKYELLCMYQTNIFLVPLELTHSAKFLYNNYVQALTLLHDMPTAIATLTGMHLNTDIPYHTWLDQERNYLNSRLDESDTDIVKGEYIELLKKLKLAK